VSRHPESELSAYAAGSLFGDERMRVEQHLSECAACRAAVADFRVILDQLATSTPAPPEVAWPRYRAEVRARRDARAQRSWRARWLRPLPVAASAAVAAACAIVLYVAVGARPPADFTSMEADGLAARIEFIDKYQVVEQLDLLEDLDVIKNLDRVAPSTRGG
jgi:anti-sigma factor RsiW